MKNKFIPKNLMSIAIVSAFAFIIIPQIGSAQFVPADKVLVSKSTSSGAPVSTIVLSTNHPRNRAETTSVISVKDTQTFTTQHEPVVTEMNATFTPTTATNERDTSWFTPAPTEVHGTLTQGYTAPVRDTSWVTQMNNQPGNNPPTVVQQQPSTSQGGFVQNASVIPQARGTVTVPAIAQAYQDSARGPVVMASQNTPSPKTVKNVTKRTQLETVDSTDNFADTTHTSQSQYGASVSGISMSVSLMGILLIVLVFLIILNLLKKTEGQKKTMGNHQAMPVH